ncbi:tRNA lysidine(34) synthetase TilS [Kangiella shandongensis]|uniref:tRNA lysidine(34) synthetase TilS n=1 Tax=Kangiella shandongensis TaxID=2763258 RepID=UPI001CBEF2D0|nr:tRNA lysidine(34) synthetase TilS [Kangiella shandongensis]
MPNQEPAAAAITQFLAQFPPQKNSHFVVALSGGADSIALLHALSKQVDSEHILAVYINHQLQPESSEWAQFNRDICQRWGIPFKAIDVTVNADAASLENEARRARYDALAQFITDQQLCLLTAHHKDDQVETLLLQLFRGAGPKGLSAMPLTIAFAEGVHARPFLALSKQDILNYCAAYGLAFVEDPSNEDTKHRRNFLRQKVIPLLEQEWPQLRETLYRVSELQADTQQVIEEQAQQDLAACYEQGKGLSLEVLGALSPPRQHNVLRYWLSQLGLTMPSRKVLQQLTQQMLQSESDSQPAIEWQGGVFRRHTGFLLWDSGRQQALDFTPTTWEGQQDLRLSDKVLLPARWLQQRYPELVGRVLTVSLRQGGERFRKPNSTQTTSLKNYFQETGVPSWQRSNVVLISYQDEVRAIYTEHLADYLKNSI